MGCALSAVRTLDAWTGRTGVWRGSSPTLWQRALRGDPRSETVSILDLTNCAAIRVSFKSQSNVGTSHTLFLVENRTSIATTAMEHRQFTLLVHFHTSMVSSLALQAIGWGWGWSSAQRT